MENFDGENIDELLEIRQYFPPSKFCAVQYTTHKSVTFSRFKRALNCNKHQLFMIVSCGQTAFSFAWLLDITTGR